MKREPKALTDDFAKTTAGKTPACAGDFGAVCDATAEKQYLSYLEQLLLTIDALDCLGAGKHRAQEERINQLLLTLVTTAKPYVTSRLKVELRHAVNRKRQRVSTRTLGGRPYGCGREEKHELRPVEDDPQEYRQQRRDRAPRAMADRPRWMDAPRPDAGEARYDG